MKAPSRVPYSFAFLRIVPHVHLGGFSTVGVVLLERTSDFLGIRFRDDALELADGVDTEILDRYLRLCERLCAGDPAAGPVALLPVSERFHWLTAPRSDVLQPSPVHAGLCLDPGSELETLFRSCVHAR